MQRVSRQVVRQIQVSRNVGEMRREARESIRLGRNYAGTRRQGKCTKLFFVKKYSGESWPSYHKDGKTIWRKLVLLLLLKKGS